MANEQEKSVVKYTSRDNQQITLSPPVIKKYLVSGNPDLVTPQELYLYMGICKSRGLNPFIKDCYLIKYTPKDAAAIVVSIDYYRKRARAQTDCQGWTTGITLIDSKGNIVRREGCLLLDGEKLVGAWFEAKPAGWSVPMKKEINLERYIKKTREGNVTRFWSKENQPEQIAKVVESQGLRATWPDEFQGLYVDAERESMEAQAELGEAVGTEDKKSDKEAPKKLQDALGKPEAKNETTKKQIESEGVDETEKSLSTKKEEKSQTSVLHSTDDRHHKNIEAEVGVSDPWQRDNWINLRQPGFSTFVHKNLEAFKELPADYQALIIDKWHALYEEPFPQHEAPAPPDPGLETEHAEDPEEEERHYIIKEIKADYSNEEISKAYKEAFKQENAHGAWPPTLDGCQLLLKKCQELKSG